MHQQSSKWAASQYEWLTSHSTQMQGTLKAHHVLQLTRGIAAYKEQWTQ